MESPSFWKDFLSDAKQFENCVVVCKGDQKYNSHKVLLARIPILKDFLSQEDTDDISVIMLPDFDLTEVLETFEYNSPTDPKTELRELLEGISPVVPDITPSSGSNAAHERNKKLQEKTAGYEAGTELESQIDMETCQMEELESSFIEDCDDPFANDSEIKKKPRDVTKRKTRTSKSKNHPNAELSCEDCDRSFSNQRYLDSHITLVHPEKSQINNHMTFQSGHYKCILCGKTFTLARKCRYHLKFKHKVGANFQCQHCDRMFFYEYELKGHQRFHDGERNFECELCDKKFFTDQRLSKHLESIHTPKEEKNKLRNFFCQHCAKGFFSKAALQEHEYLHSEKKNFFCTSCGMTFKQSSGLRAHNNRHHRDGIPKKNTEEHKEKMRAYMKRYRAIKAGKVADDINRCFKPEKAAARVQPEKEVSRFETNPSLIQPTRVVSKVILPVNTQPMAEFKDAKKYSTGDDEQSVITFQQYRTSDDFIMS